MITTEISTENGKSISIKSTGNFVELNIVDINSGVEIDVELTGQEVDHLVYVLKNAKKELFKKNEDD